MDLSRRELVVAAMGGLGALLAGVACGAADVAPRPSGVDAAPDVVPVSPPTPAPARSSAAAPVATGLHRVQRLAAGPRFLRAAGAIVFDEADEPLRLLDGGRTEAFPELAVHMWDPEDITGLGSTRIIALAGAWPGHAVGARLRFFFNDQNVYLAEPVTLRDGRWEPTELVESFAGIGTWTGGCFITPSMSDVRVAFGGQDPKFRPHFVVLGCPRATDLPILPSSKTWIDAFGSTEAGHAVLVGRDDDDEVVLHHWVPGQRTGRRHVLAGLTVDSRNWTFLGNERWLADERNPIVWRSPTEPVVFLRVRDTSQPIADPRGPAPSLDSVVAFPDGATWRSATLPGVQLERFAAGPDGTIWMTGGGRLWRMTTPEAVESVALAPVDAGDQPTVPIDVMPVGPRTLWLVAEHGPEGRREVSLFRYDAPDPLGPTTTLTPR